jgi:hypothetical protein
VSVDVVVPLNAVQMRSRADHQRSSRKQRMKRVVVPPATLPKNVIAALHQSRRTRRWQAFRRPTLPIPVHTRNRNRKLGRNGSSGCVCVLDQERRTRRRALLLSQSEVNERAYGPAAGGKETSWEEEIDATGGEETHGME